MKSKLQIPFGKPLIGEQEIAAVNEVLRGTTLVHGPRTQAFEDSFNEFTGAENSVAVSSCTAGMHLVYFALGLGPGDEVLVPAQTHVATAHAIRLTGATPVFIDSEIQTGNIDASKIEQAITGRTKAIAVVHYLGVPVNMFQINAVAKKHHLFVLEDCALALGARFDGAHVGTLGDVGVFSFYPVKHLTTTEGGMITAKNSDFAARLRLLRAFGINRNHSERSVSGIYDTLELGFNYRMSEVNAAIGLVQLSRVKQFLVSRRKNFEYLLDLLSSQIPDEVRILPQPCTGEFLSSHYCMSVLLGDNLARKRTSIIQSMSETGVGTSIYYPHPVPRMSYYKGLSNNWRMFPIAAMLSDQSIALTVGPHLGTSEIEHVASSLIQAVASK